MILTLAMVLISADAWPPVPVGSGDGWPNYSDPMAHWGWPEAGYLVESKEDERLHAAGIKAFRASWEYSQYPAPIISITAGGLFSLPESYRPLFAAREYRCSSCWDFRELADETDQRLQEVVYLSLAAAGIDPADYPLILILTKSDNGHSWDEIRPLRPLSQLVRAGYFRQGNWYAAQMEGEGLYSIPIRKIAIVYPQPEYPLKLQPPAAWVITRLGTAQGEPYLDYAMSNLKGLAPAEYLQKHKYFPMDRTPRDMAFGPLRYEGPTIPHYVDIEDPTVPYYNQYWGERKRWMEEQQQYIQQLDDIFGTKSKFPALLERMMQEQPLARQYCEVFSSTGTE